MSLNVTTPLCPTPFLHDGSYGDQGGGLWKTKRSIVTLHRLTLAIDIQGRFCVYLTQHNSTTSCCLPCPVTRWIYSDQFPEKLQAANYMAVPSLASSLFLLCTYVVGWKRNGTQSYWTIGLTASLSLVTISFVIPVSSLPDLCYDSITPNNLHTDVACAFTGATLLLGAMGAVVWSKCAILPA